MDEPEADYGALRTRRIDDPLHRIVPSRFPTALLFDAARNEDELLMLAELEGLTNDRLRQELGEIQLVSKGEGLYGPGATPVMAAFCHPAPSRFTSGLFGVYYAGLSEQTAILETVYHRERFLRAAGIAREVLEMRCYVTRVQQNMTLLPSAQRDSLLDPDDYAAAQRFGAALRKRGAWGIFYNSVRDTPDGRCVAVLRPRALAAARQSSHFRYYWDGERIGRIEKIESYAVREA